jgi:predicted metal-dependent hydrolase
VQIVVPKRMSKRRINDIVEEKANWIRRAIEQEAAAPKFQPKAYRPGEEFLHLGKSYVLAPSTEAIDWPILQDDRLLVSGSDSPQIKAQIAAWYLHEATQFLTTCTAKYESLMGVRANSIKTKYYKSRWGACSPTGDLTYNWRIIMAPAQTVDYVVVHELAHLLHHNHSPRFWGCVAKTMPDYKDHNKWLKENGHLLRLE